MGKELEAERARLRDQLKKTDEKLTVKPKGPSQPISPKKLKIGDGVKVLSMNLKGTVSTLPNARGDLYVQMGILRSLVNIRDLELLNEKDISATLGDGSSISYGGKAARGKGSGSSQIKMSKSSTVSAEVNLIGMTVDEAVPAMENIWTTPIWPISRQCAWSMAVEPEPLRTRCTSACASSNM